MIIEQQEFVAMVGYEGYYEITTTGLIRSAKTGRILTSLRSDMGYWIVYLSVKNFRKREKVHRLLAQTFIDNPHSYPMINHINGIRDDNRIENLEWCTQAHNISHSYKIGNHKPVSTDVFNARKIVIDLETGVFYNSAIELSNLIDLNYSTLRSYLNGARPNKTHYEYA